jgi:hypothetical protein
VRALLLAVTLWTGKATRLVRRLASSG